MLGVEVSLELLDMYYNIEMVHLSKFAKFDKALQGKETNENVYNIFFPLQISN